MHKQLITKISSALLIVMLSFAALPMQEAQAAIGALQAWTNVYHGTSTNAQNITYTVPTGSDTYRVLVVAIASSKAGSAGARTVTLSYGGQTLTSVAGDMATATVQQHTQLYYLNEAGLDAATNTRLSVTVSGGTTRVTDVFAAVFDGVDQTNPITASQTYSSGTGTTNNPVFTTGLNVNANDQAVEIVSSMRLNNTPPRTITYATNWTMSQEQAWATTDGVRNGVANRNIPDTNVVDTSSTNLSGVTLASMTAMSLRAAILPLYTINANSGTGGTITPSGAVSVDEGTNQTFTIVPNASYIVQDVLVDSASQGAVNSYTFNNVTAGHSISATFDGGWFAPNSSINGTGGNGLTNPGNASSSDDAYAVVANAGGQTAQYYGFAGLSIPVTDVIDGIQVSLEGNQTGSRTFIVSLTWDGGTTFQTPITQPAFGIADSTVVVGSSSSTAGWGAHTWMPAEINSTNFRVRVTGSGGNGFVSLDQLQVKVYHHISPILRTITTTAGAGGTINPSGTVVVADGGMQAFTSAPNATYIVQDVLVDGGTQGMANSYTFTNVIADHTISAAFDGGWYAPGGNVNGGGGNGTTNPGNGYASDNAYMTATGNGQNAAYTTFNISPTTTITGIAVALEGNTTGRNLTVALSWNGGTNYTGTTYTTAFTGTDSTIIVGGSGNTWGRTWAAGDFTNFRVRVNATGGGGTVSLDQLQVKVYYSKTDQAISVGTAAPASAGYESTFPVVATATSGLGVDITTTGGCSGNGTGSATITMTSSTIACVVHYNQAGDATYNAAPEVTSSTAATKAAATVTLGSLAQTYDGSAKSATATTSPPGLTVDFTYDGLATAPTNAGSYAVVGTINDANYAGSATDTLVISKAAATITLGNLAQTYDGSAKSATATTNPVGLTVDFTYDGLATAPTNAGSYVVVGTINDANYAGSATDTLVISKAAATVTLGSLAQTYDGSAKSATATTNPVGLTVDFTYDGLATAPTNAGSYVVVGTINDANYAGSATDTLVISKAAATVTLGSLAQTYDGSAKSATATTSPLGLTVDFTYDGLATAPTNAGSYAVVGTINDANYAGSATDTLVISKAAATVTLGSLAQTYDGSAKSATATTSPLGLTVDFTYDGLATAPTNAGSYVVVGTINDANYAGSATDTLVISKAAATVTLGSLAQTYDGSAKSATATTSPLGLTVDFTYDGLATAPTNAGSYAVVGTINDANYAGSATDTLVISKAAATVTLGNLAQTYDGSAKSATATTSPLGLTVDFTYDGLATAPTNAGSYVVVGTINDANYAGSATDTLVISKAAATVTLGNLAQTYDGSAKSATATTNPVGLTVDFTYDGLATAPTNAGSYVVVGTINDANYAGSATDTLVISKAAATVTLGSLAQTYDGSAKSATATTNPLGLTVDFTYDGLATAPTNAGSYVVVGTINDANYAGSATDTLVISKAAATVTLGNLAQTYDGSAKSATATTNPLGLTVDFTYDGLATAPTNAGSYVVVGTINDANYAGTANGTLVISKAAATVTLGNLAQTYDGSAKSATATTNPLGLTVDFTYDGLATAPTNAGSYVVVGTINDANYAGTANGTLVISKATATVTLGSLAQTYDGSAKSATATTNPVGLTVDFTYDGLATAPTNAGSYAVVGTINDANYAGSVTDTLVISKAAATVTLGSLAQTYDGSAKSATATTTPLGLTVDFTYDGLATAPTNAGSYVVVGTINDIDYAGIANGTLVISQASQSISFTSVAPVSAVAGGPVYTPTATGSGSSNPVVFTIDPASSSVCLISLGDVSFLAAGTCTINANQAGDTNYSAAPQIQQSFGVGQGSQTITFTSTAPANASVGGATYTPTATGGASGNPIVFTIDAASASVCSISGGVVSFQTAGACVINANQAGDANYTAAPQAQQPFGVDKATPVITWATPADIVYGTALSGTQLNASTTVPGTFTYTPALGTIVNAGAGQTLSVDFVPNDIFNYNNVNGTTVTINVLQAAPTLSVKNSPVTYNGAPQVAIVAGSVPGTVSNILYDGSATAPTLEGTYAITADFAPTDATNYNSLAAASAGNFVIKSDDYPNFSDVPIDYWAWQYIEAIYAAGITTGCGDGNYCPTAPVTRAQMAIFLLRGIHGKYYIPPDATGTVFTDVPVDYWAAGWIEQLASEGITSGCGDGNYCPDALITRAEMSIFLLRTKYGNDYVPPVATGAIFADIPADYWAAGWVEQLFQEGVARGCGDGNFCPNIEVTRDQMAAFLQRLFGFPLP